MNAKNLMIGDWVMYNHHTLARIDSIQAPMPRKGRFDNKWLITISRDGLIDTEEEYIEPIPLTTEILEKNGWYHDGIFMERRANENIQLSWTDRCGAVLYKNSYEMCDCKYVHELQHALRLCRLDDLADNFKVIE